MDESERAELEETGEVADDGTLPMPEGEEEEGEPSEESRIKKLRKKSEKVEESKDFQHLLNFYLPNWVFV